MPADQNFLNVDRLQGSAPGGRKDVQQSNCMKMNPTVLNINKYMECPGKQPKKSRYSDRRTQFSAVRVR